MKEGTRQAASRTRINVLLGLAIVLAIITIFSVNWFVKANHVPYLKETTFVFGYGEPIPTSSEYYISHDVAYEDISFDEQHFLMREIGTYDVQVEFAEMPFTIRIVIEDQDDPIITFSEEELVSLYRIQGNLQTSSLFSVRDTSDVTIDEITPALDVLQSGVQEICVTASDPYKHTSKECKTMNIEVVDYAIASPTKYESVEALVTDFVQKYGLNKETFGFFYYSTDDDESYIYNGNGVFLAASTIKVPLNMLYYDSITNNKIKANTSLTLSTSDVEGGDGNTLVDYRVGQRIPLSYLQAECIINSDNTATNVLINGLGGFNTFRSLLPQYSDATLPSNFKSENIITLDYMYDVMVRLYNNQERYPELIANMKQASYGQYLQSSTNVFEIAQKYGLYDSYLHSVGIVYTPKPYVVGIYTNYVAQAEDIIKKLNEQLIAYQLQK